MTKDWKKVCKSSVTSEKDSESEMEQLKAILYNYKTRKKRSHGQWKQSFVDHNNIQVLDSCWPSNIYPSI